jgi:RHS repeat-associated protein
VQHSIFQYDGQLLAQQQCKGGTVATTMLITDHQRSVLNTLDAAPHRTLAYTPYGHCSPGHGLLSLLGFNGEPPDPVTGHYHLGNGYRQFNAVLKRFNSPDSWSPFGKGGVNAYAYCEGDPINRVDPTGHALLKNLVAMLKSPVDFTLDDHWFVHELGKMKKALGGNNVIREAARLEKTSPEKYLFNQTVNKELDRQKTLMDGLKDRINMASSPEVAMMNNFELAQFGSKSSDFRPQVLNYRLMDMETDRKSLSVYRGISPTLDEANRMTYNRIMALANVPPHSRPPYSLSDTPSYHDAPPSYEDVVNNIRKS